jgi:hypothetical protein
MELEKDNLKKGEWGGARDDSGRDPFIPSDQEKAQVELLSGYGIPFEQIAIMIRDGISPSTLRRHFADELLKGKGKANAQVGRGLFQKAMAGDTSAMIWWSKSQMKWSETVKQELTGAEGVPLLKGVEITFVEPDGIRSED